MKIPITKYGMPQVIIYPAICAVVIAAIAPAAVKFPILWIIEALLAIILVWALSFFRDPKRNVPKDTNLLLAPADGIISDIENVNETDFINAPAIRIGIFLSVFNVHLNRVPCPVKIEKTIYRKGKFINAMNLQSSKVNESNSVAMTRTVEPKDKLVVRQISGAIARRIVCDTQTGQEFAGGEIFGMIKFGSRTELYIPADSRAKICVKKGDKARAGLTVFAKYE